MFRRIWQLRWRFTLRFLLVGVTAVCIVLGTWIHKVRRQQAVCESLRAHGIYVSYSRNHNADGIAYDALGQAPHNSALRERLASVFGMDYVYTITCVSLLDQPTAWRVGDTDLAPLRFLTELQGLNLGDSMITNRGLESVCGLAHLKRLTLNNTEITPGAGEQLKRLKSLKYLNVQWTELSQAEVERLRAALPDAEILWCPRIEAAGTKLPAHPMAKSLPGRALPAATAEVGTLPRNVAKEAVQVPSTQRGEAPDLADASVADPDPIAVRSELAKSATNITIQDAMAVPVPESQMILIPAGEVVTQVMELYEYSDARKFHVDAFYIDKYEVSVRQYKAFLAATQWPPPYTWKLYSGKEGVCPSGTDDLPAWDVSFEDAEAFADWRGVRLPTELEWERAAKGDMHWEYPWGNSAESARANVNVVLPRKSFYYQALAPVTAYPDGASPFGVQNMIGNVWEWTATPDGFTGRFIKGGCCILKLHPIRYHEQAGGPADDVGHGPIGFRCASSAAEEKRQVR